MKIRSQIALMLFMVVFAEQPAKAGTSVWTVGMIISSSAATLGLVASGIGMGVMDSKIKSCVRDSVGCYDGYELISVPEINCTIEPCSLVKVCNSTATGKYFKLQEIKDCSSLKESKQDFEKATIASGITAGVLWFLTGVKVLID